MNVLVIEDEIAAARGLTKMLMEINSDIKILAQLDSIQDSVQWLQSNQSPDLMFLDIQLKDGLSFEIFDQVSCFSPAIFCTAFDQYAIEAFKLNSIDYLLKPYEKAGLKKALDKLEKVKKKSGGGIDYQSLAKAIQKEKSGFKERFLVRAGKKFYQVSMNKIAYLYTSNKVNFLKTKDNKQYVVDEFLDELEHLLDPAFFFRINRQFIVSVDAVTSLENDYGKYYVNLEPAHTKGISVSRNRLSDFKKWLGQ